MDVNVIKFGIAGARHGGSSGWGRLHQYVNTYGEKGTYDCNGVTLYLLVGTEYKSTVQPENALVTRKELKLKRELKGDLIKGRGTERVTTWARRRCRDIPCDICLKTINLNVVSCRDICLQ